MTTTQTIQWTTLPNGLDEAGNLRISVFVAPRLRSDEGTTLSLFPDFVQWAAKMQPDVLKFEIEAQGLGTLPAAIISPPPDPQLWAALFSETTPVKPFKFDDYADRPLISYDVTETLDFFKQAYVELARTTLNDLPNALAEGGAPNLQTVFQPVLDLLRGSHLFEGVQDEREFSQRVSTLLDYARAQARARRSAPTVAAKSLIEPLPAFAGDARSHLQQAFFFHQRPQRTPAEFPETRDEAQTHFEEKIDFHQMLSALGDYPRLMRMLGLVFDLLIPGDALPLRPDGTPYQLRVLPQWQSDLPVRQAPPVSPWTVDALPWTQTFFLDIQEQRFFTAAADGLIALLPLRQNYDVVQVDVDGVVLKTFGLAETLNQMIENPYRPIEEPQKAGAPALRTGGVALVRKAHARHLHDDFYRSRGLDSALENGNPVSLGGLDLIRGYQLDVWEARDNTWRSLHARTGTYQLLNLGDPPLQIDDEGFAQVGVTGEADGKNAPADPDGELYAHQRLITWDGWSLSAPRPGLIISRSPRAPTPDQPDTQPQVSENPAMTRMRMEVDFKPQRQTLPRLRFGQEYRFRLRAVDLGGNSLTMVEADRLTEFLQALDPGLFVLPEQEALHYARYEPVPAPALVPRRPFGEGESAERLVIRSNYDLSAEAYAQTEIAAHAQVPYAPFCDRHIAAPKASLQLIETHGMLDAAFGGRSPTEMQAVYDIAARERGGFNDAAPGMQFIATNSEGDSEGGYAVHEVEQVGLPYLPDPYADGAVFYGLPGVPMGQPFVIRFDPLTDWHDRQPFRLRLVEGSEAPTWNPATRELAIFMPRGRWLPIRMSSAFGGNPETMGILRWCLEAVNNGTISPADFDNITAALKESRHWMFTPWRDLTLVHAVQQPLAVPRFELGRLDPPNSFARGYNATAAYLALDVAIDGPSTARIDLTAHWRIPEDDAGAAMPRDGGDMLDFTTQVLNIAVPDQGTTPLDLQFEPALNYRDEMLLHIDTRLRHEFRPMLENTLNATPNWNTAERVRLQNAIAQLDQLQPHEFGDTKYRRVEYRVSATSRFREYFPVSLGADPENYVRTSDTMVVDVLSTAPPAKPQLRYVIPSMRWEDVPQPDQSGLVSTRHGGSIRVYMDRGWYSSGDGELLGLVVSTSSVTTLTSNDYSLVTYWGQDPAWASSPPSVPTVRSFRNPVAIRERVRLQETLEMKLGTRLYTIVGFAPAFDPERRLWFCDIELDTEQAYFPFVRLALVRFQPLSLEGVEVSPVVLADFVQTMPDRTLSVTRSADAPNLLDVQLTGPAPFSRRNLDKSVVHSTNEVTVMLERRDDAIADETLGWVHARMEAVTLTPDPLTPNTLTVWRGQITLPEDAGRYRLVAREYEIHVQDEFLTGGFREARRSVFVNTIEV